MRPLSLSVLLLFLSAGNLLAQGNCRATPISGTGSASSYSVWKDGAIVSSHTTFTGAEQSMAAQMEADSTAAVAILQYLKGVWRRPNGNECGPDTADPPWPPVFPVEGAFQIDSIRAVPASITLNPQGVSCPESPEYGQFCIEDVDGDGLYSAYRMDIVHYGNGGVFWGSDPGRTEWDSVKVVGEDQHFFASGDQYIEIAIIDNGMRICRVEGGQVVDGKWVTSESMPVGATGWNPATDPAQLPACTP